MRLNKPVVAPPVFTYEGAPAQRGLTPFQKLRRMCLAALLFEDSFYKSGSAHAKEIQGLIKETRPELVAALAIECRDRMYLRHMPLFLVRELARIKGNGRLVANTLAHVIQRPDELGEYLAIYWDGNASGNKKRPEPLSAGTKRGLAAAFAKFDEQTLAKYDGDNAVKLRDVLRIVHAKPKDWVRSETYRKVVKRELGPADTWEVALSAGADKKSTFERLIREKKLGGLAFLRNLRNMIGAGVDDKLMRERFLGGFGKVLPFRFVAALRYAPQYARDLDIAMQRCLSEMEKLPGQTAILVDVSASMNVKLSKKSEMLRVDVAAGLAVLVSAVCERPRVFSFSKRCVEVPAFGGLALVDTVKNSQANLDTYTGRAVEQVNLIENLDRIIIITDEQSHDKIPAPKAKAGYVINVSQEKNGIGYGPWVHIDGWSERVLDFIKETERG